MSLKILYQCSQCKLHYETKELSERYEEFCKKYQGCSLEITKHSIERKKFGGQEAKKV